MNTTMYALIVTEDGNLLHRTAMGHHEGDVWVGAGSFCAGHVVGYQQGKRIWPAVVTGDATSWPVTAGMSWYVTLGGSIHEPTEADQAKAHIDWLTEHGYLDLMPGLTGRAIAFLTIPESRQ